MKLPEEQFCMQNRLEGSDEGMSAMFRRMSTE